MAMFINCSNKIFPIGLVIFLILILAGTFYNFWQIKLIKKAILTLPESPKISERKTPFLEPNTIFQSGKGKIGSLDLFAGKIVITMINPNYAGSPYKNVEAVYQKKVLLFDQETKFVELSFKGTPSFEIFSSSQEKEISPDSLKVGDSIDFISKEKFDFYSSEEILVEKIIRIP